uniref:Non-haem dioxygenase N-terminal domain-containing protein n=1 Tax=Chromera velia CCMP2878 TaxID=1169474 RepID=A0A0G4F2K0_9ALVE|eukprot:Cvel_14731.t1-p1 / transcript=Cvel_14731.t1 / gene=Cvel_14731 / organism=Chromera_velia_CCMP2878 / gene_product=hypothetical protein / transcript_product=hypothetical protein / location=Cvel_scaffold1059:45834-49114(-) / protein_length=379 / sequence_SO=supercontig / SO=protein_coding / is_pseudo=false
MSADVEGRELVVLNYEELLSAETSEDLRQKIERAYSFGGLGILAVRGVPDLLDARKECLPLAFKFASLPEAVKEKYVHSESFFSFGWSHGKEKLEGKPDLKKGSYYANPVLDRPYEDEKIIRDHSSFAHPNIWPSEEDCPGFEKAFKRLGGLIVKTGEFLARHCDAYVSTQLVKRGGDAARKDVSLVDVVTKCRCHKARLLYYFPRDTDEEDDEGEEEKEKKDDISGWCGWHNDHGSLTGLAPGMFFNEKGEEVECPDAKAGLYVKSRTGEVVRVVTPPGCLAFQIGEAEQLMTGGILQATPHCVRPPSKKGVSRSTLAVFMEPEWAHLVAAPRGIDDTELKRGANGELLPPGVPALLSRWKEGMDFGEFTEKTLGAYY